MINNERMKLDYLICNDCIEGLKDIQSDSVNLVLTDPPYNLGHHMKTRGSGVHRL